MNILFANYGDFRSNSLNHIAPFANALVERGHNCLVAVPKNLRTSHCIRQRLFSYGTYEDVLTSPYHFTNGEPADIIHAWTPRIGVATFVSRYAARYPTPAVVTHLEDHEDTLIEDLYAAPIRELATMERPPGRGTWVSELSHPLQHKAFLALSDAVTAINSKLLILAPTDRPKIELHPGLEPPPLNRTVARLRSIHRLKDDDQLIVYPGGVTASNIDDIVELIEAIRFLRERGATQLRLVKTGPTSPALADRCNGPIGSFVLDLGFVGKSEVLAWLETADLLVQPGRDNTFNRFRLPSKLPEFLLSGKPVIAPAACLGGRLVNGTNALLLYRGSKEEIAEKIAWISEHPDQAGAIGLNGRELAKTIFSLDSNTQKLLQFYQDAIESPIRTWRPSRGASQPFRAAVRSRIKRDHNGYKPHRASADLRDYLSSAHLLETDSRPVDRSIKFNAQRTAKHYLTRWKSMLRARFARDRPHHESNSVNLDAPPQTYEISVDQTERLTAHCLASPAEDRDESRDSLKPSPKISVLIPVYRSDISLLEAAISSVKTQSYKNWEICIVDDASLDQNIRSLLLRLHNENERIKVSFRSKNGHICNASNDALAMATGEYVALLDHDDILSPLALASVAQAIKAHPNARLIYTDEDKIDTSGRHSEPHYKSAWNPDLLVSQNYIGHLSVLKTDTVRSIGGFRPGFEGSQDWDLLLRIARVCDERDIIHIPQVLYHWRQTQSSTALNPSAKSYAFDSAKRALSSYVGSSASKIQIEPVNKLYWRTNYKIDNFTNSLTIVAFGSSNQLAESTFEHAIYSATSRRDVQICHVRISGADTHERVQNAIRGIDEAILETNSENILVIDNLLRPYNKEWLDEIASQCARVDIGIVGPKLLNPDKSIRHAFQVLEANHQVWRVFENLRDEDGGYFNKAHLTSNVTILSLHAMAFRRSVWKEIGGIGTSCDPAKHAGISFSSRSISAGYRNIFTPFSKLIYNASPPAFGVPV